MENELVVQVSMKQEMELAMKLLEKDIHEKQVTNQTLLHPSWPLLKTRIESSHFWCIYTPTFKEDDLSNDGAHTLPVLAHVVQKTNQDKFISEMKKYLWYTDKDVNDKYITEKHEIISL